MNSPPQIFAHRGDSGSVPENTLAAFESAISAGADGVEFDVQRTLDGEIVVIHDESLQRTAGNPAQVGEMALQDLQGLDAGSWFGPQFSGQRVPTLAQVLELLGPTGLIINIELKTNRVPYAGLAGQVLNLVEQFGLMERIILSSFNHHSLAEAKQLAPRVACAAVVETQLLEPWAYVAYHGFQALHPTHHAITEQVVAQCHAAGLAVRPWTVDEREVAEAMLILGVDGIITNYPARLLQWRDG